VSLSLSSRSPVTASQPRLDEHQVGGGLCATGAPHRSWSSGHLFSCPCSPTYWVPLSGVSEPTAHLTVRLCQAMTALPMGDCENSVTVGLSTCRRSQVPLRRNVLTRRRDPPQALQCARCASAIGPGVAWKKLDSIHTEGVGYTDVRPTSVQCHPWTLGCGQASSHPIAQALQDHAIHVC
jgi:hypothetical protein